MQLVQIDVMGLLASEVLVALLNEVAVEPCRWTSAELQIFAAMREAPRRETTLSRPFVPSIRFLRYSFGVCYAYFGPF